MKNTSNQARPCLVTPVTRSGAITEPIKALFYGLVKVQEVVLPSYLEGRKIKDDIVAVVELEDGTIRKVPLERVHLLDSAEKFAGYDWEAEPDA
jgi:hypothetical protein